MRAPEPQRLFESERLGVLKLVESSLYSIEFDADLDQCGPGRRADCRIAVLLSFITLGCVFYPPESRLYSRANGAAFLWCPLRLHPRVESALPTRLCCTWAKHRVREQNVHFHKLVWREPCVV